MPRASLSVPLPQPTSSRHQDPCCQCIKSHRVRILRIDPSVIADLDTAVTLRVFMDYPHLSLASEPPSSPPSTNTYHTSSTHMHHLTTSPPRRLYSGSFHGSPVFVLILLRIDRNSLSVATNRGYQSQPCFYGDVTDLKSGGTRNLMVRSFTSHHHLLHPA